MGANRIAAGGGLALLAALAAACGSSGGGTLQPPDGAPSSTAASSSPTVPATTISVKMADYGSRCPPAGWSSDSGTRIAVSGITRLVVCPQRVPLPHGRPIRLTRGDADFAALLRQISLPSTPARPGRMCPMYATVPEYVLAAAGGQWYVVDLPTDGCGHYRTPLLRLLTRLRS